MSEAMILNVIEYLRAAADEASVDPDGLYRAMIGLRPNTSLADALEDELSQLAIQRGQNA